MNSLNNPDGQCGKAGQDFSGQLREPGPTPIWATLGALAVRQMPAGRYRLLRLLRRLPERVFWGSMPKRLGGHRFHCSLRDQIAREVFFTGCYEPQETACLREVLQPGMTFVDAGANWGFFTLIAANLVGPAGKVIAIEADPRVCLKLRCNVEKNQLEQVTLFPVAVADQERKVIMAAHDETGENFGVSRLTENHFAAPHLFEVQGRSLDSILDDARVLRVDLLKIDVEGAEDLVLRGMERGLKQQRYRSILLEVHPAQLAERGHTIKEVTNWLSTRGYVGYALDYSPATTRRAHYKPQLHFSEFARPLKQVIAAGYNDLDREQIMNIHTFWSSPDEQLT